ncbi:MAG: R3H domain-containing nucleic acid-binding protein [Candidatus Nealsonbacteria bacterium]
MEQQQLDIIKQTIKEFFEFTAFEVEIEFWPPKEETIPINIKTQEPQMLIGEGGQTLSDLQHILKAILRKKIAQPFYISLDINDYKKRKTEYLKEMAREMANEVSLLKKEKELAPMPAYERRIVHMELAERDDVVSESSGQEPERKIIIKPRA